MAFSDLFNPTILVILLVVLSIGALYSYVSFHISNQKAETMSMISVMSSLVDETKMLRYRIATLEQNNFEGNKRVEELDEVENLEYATQLLPDESELISVSDNEEDDISEDEDEDDISEDDDETSVNDSDSDSDSDDEEIKDEENKNIILENLDNDTFKMIHLEEPLDLTFTSISNENKDNVQENNYDDIDLNINLEFKTDNFGPETLESDNLEPETSVNIDLEKHDYKKLPLNKLRNIVVNKGLSSDASKLKKNEILKLLGDE